MAGAIRYWKNLSSRERLIIGIAIAIAFVDVGYDFVVEPMIESYEKKTEMLASRQQLLKKYEHLIETAERTRDKLQRITAIESAIKKGLLTGTNPDLANAELQGLVKTLAQKADITFTTINSNKVIEKDGFLELGVSVVFTAQIQQIERFVFELETAAQFLYIQELTIKSQRRNRNNLQVDMDITGFIRNAEPFVATDETKEKSRKLDT